MVNGFGCSIVFSVELVSGYISYLQILYFLTYKNVYSLLRLGITVPF